MRNEKPLSFVFFQSINRQRCSEAFPECVDWTASDWALALAGETGELCNLLKKIRRGDFTLQSKRSEILAELADIITYADLMISNLGASTSTELVAKFNMVSRRRDWGILESELPEASS